MWSSSVSEAFLKKCGMPAGMKEVSPTPTGNCSPSMCATAEPRRIITDSSQL